MSTFPSEEWVQEFKAELNNSDAYAEAAKNWEGDFVFVVNPDDGDEEPQYLYLDLWHGECREAEMLDDPSKRSPAFTWTGKYSDYLKIIGGELDPIKGLMQGKFKLKGNMATIMRSVKAAQELVNCLKAVPTDDL